MDVPADEVIVLETPEPASPRGCRLRVRPALSLVRRAIFFDVENTSRPEHIARVIEHLAVDRTGSAPTSSRSVTGGSSATTPRALLARHGAHLVHSAPSVGVRDWSDLRIAVAPACGWRARAPATCIEIVTSDRAFDAVGDVAASLGIAFRRLSDQGLGRGGHSPPRSGGADGRFAVATVAVAAGGGAGGARGPASSAAPAHAASAPVVPAPVDLASAPEVVPRSGAHRLTPVQPGLPSTRAHRATR